MIKKYRKYLRGTPYRVTEWKAMKEMYIVDDDVQQGIFIEMLKQGARKRNIKSLMELRDGKL